MITTTGGGSYALFCDAIVAHETSTHIRGYQGLRDSGANFGGVSDRGQPLAPVLTQILDRASASASAFPVIPLVKSSRSATPPSP